MASFSSSTTPLWPRTPHHKPSPFVPVTLRERERGGGGWESINMDERLPLRFAPLGLPFSTLTLLPPAPIEIQARALRRSPPSSEVLVSLRLFLYLSLVLLPPSPCLSYSSSSSPSSSPSAPSSSPSDTFSGVYSDLTRSGDFVFFCSCGLRTPIGGCRCDTFRRL